MATTTEVAPEPERAKRRWTTEEFRRLVDDGFIRDGSRTFLWDGEIIEPMAKKPAHRNAEAALMRLLYDHFPAGEWSIFGDTPLHLKDGFDPQPDLLVMRGPLASYQGRPAVPADVELLIEVASTTYTYDAGEYLEEYARAGIPTYWIVNLADRRIDVYTDPDLERGTYRSREDYHPGTMIPLAGRLAPLDDVLPSPLP